jgi:hypothetical protein
LRGGRVRRHAISPEEHRVFHDAESDRQTAQNQCVRGSRVEWIGRVTKTTSGAAERLRPHGLDGKGKSIRHVERIDSAELYREPRLYHLSVSPVVPPKDGVAASRERSYPPLAAGFRPKHPIASDLEDFAIRNRRAAELGHDKIAARFLAAPPEPK